MKSVTAYAPATISNVGPGFDIMGFAIDRPGDRLTVRRNRKATLRLINESGIELPVDPEQNVAAYAAKHYLDSMDLYPGIDIIFNKKIHPGSGIGSSAASAVAVIWALSEMFSPGTAKRELIPHAMEGEALVSGGVHADNVAPCMLGGFVLIRSYDPLDIIPLPTPSDLYCSVIHPEIEIRTAFSRSILKAEVKLKDAVKQSGNLAGLISGLFRSDYELIGRSLVDVIAEPRRSVLIPGFEKIKQRSLDTGALGCSISGSGPSIFALSESRKKAEEVASAMKTVFDELDIRSGVFVSAINTEGVKTLG